MFGNIALTFLLNVVFSNALLEKAYPHLENESPEYTSVRFLGGRNHGSRRKREVGACFQDVLSFTINVDGSDMTLQLEENTKIDMTGPVLVADDNGVEARTLPSLGQTKFFQDLIHGAAIGVTYHFLPDGSCKYHLEGTFLSANGPGTYLIHPSTHRHRYREADHILRFANSSMDFYKDISEGIRLMGSAQSSRVKRQAVLHEIQLHLVADNLVYNFWYGRVDGDSHSERNAAATGAIFQYFAYVVNGIDLRYRSISDPELAFAVLFAGLYISTTPGQSPFSSGIAVANPDNPERPLVDVSASLDAFKVWVDENPFLRPRDHTMLFSKADFTKNNRTTSAGLAFPNSTCTNSSMSVVEDIFDFTVIQIAAHQLGHSLGAAHDGTDDGTGGECSSNDRFIMANTSGSVPGPTGRNPWFFSPCSVEYFREYIVQLNSIGENCLLDRSPGSLNPETLNRFLGVQPGQFYSIDKQCEYFFRDSSSSFCRSLYNETLYPSVCQQAYCSVPDDSGFCRPIAPGRGTTCGDSKWCIDGRCTEDPKAPNGTHLAACPLGDQPGEVAVGITCADINAEFCYQEYYARVCCQTCGDFQTGNPDCLYGDTVSGCDTIGRSECYQFEMTCCGRCQPLKEPENKGCEYGDRGAGCNANDCGLYNQVTLDLCCKTCPITPGTTKAATEATTSRDLATTTSETATAAMETTTSTSDPDTSTTVTATSTSDPDPSTTVTAITTRETSAIKTTMEMVTPTKGQATTGEVLSSSTDTATCSGGPCVLNIGFSGKCDTSQDSCTEPLVSVDPNTPIHDGPGLSCRFQEIVVGESGAQTPGQATVVPGDFIGDNRVRCAVPGKTIPVLTGRRVAGWLVAVSNEGVTFGNEVLYLPVDGRCVGCSNEESPSCSWQENQCFVDGICYGDRVLNPTGPCDEQCRVEVSSVSWSTAADVCNIGGVCYADGDLNPTNGCEQCDAASPSKWIQRSVRLIRGGSSPCTLFCNYIRNIFPDHLDHILCKYKSFQDSIIQPVCLAEDPTTVPDLNCPGTTTILPRYLAFCGHTVFQDASDDPIACPPRSLAGRS